MAEQPPLNRIYVLGYAANDRDYPIVSLNADPRVAGYQVPKDLSTCPDKRYPNHVFTGAQPLSGDERVRHVWEILPSPYVPFTRYDDDLGPIQGRRRSVKNEGQVASLSADKRTTYEAREGSAIVYTELEESWSIETDEDGNSLFPIRDRDFYDASRGPVQERRQLFVPTGDEVGSLENVNGVITQTSYEPYNEFLSVKVVQTYSVDGPLLIGKATDNEGQLVTVTTQRKGAQGYNPPSPTATRTVEVAREDAESLIERVVDTPQVFDGKILSASKPDVIPESFRASVPAETTQETVAQTSVSMPVLGSDDLEKSEQRVGEHTVRKSTTSRDNGILPTLTGQQYESDVNIVVKYEESVVASGTKLGSPATIVNPLSDELDLVREFDVDAIEEELNSVSLEFPSRTSLSLPPVLRSVKIVWTSSKEDGSYTSTGQVPTTGLGSGSVSETGSASCSSSVKPDFVVELEDVYANNIPTTSHLFFLKYPVTLTDILNKLATITGKPVLQWPVFKPRSETIVASGQSKSVRVSVSGSYSISAIKEIGEGGGGAGGGTSIMISRTNGKGYGGRTEESVATLQIPPCLRGPIFIQQEGDKTVTGNATVDFNWGGGVAGNENRPATSVGKFTGGIVSTSPPDIPRKDLYLIDSKVDLYQYGFARIYAEVLDASIFA
jgi:hypothetical protein